MIMQPFCSFPQCCLRHHRVGKEEKGVYSRIRSRLCKNLQRRGEAICVAQPGEHCNRCVYVCGSTTKDQRLRGERPKCACLDVRGVCRPSFVTRIVQRRTRA